MKTYENCTDLINDLLNDQNFTDNRSNETLRAINAALDVVNIGDTGEDRGMDTEVGYDFQVEVADVTFVTTSDDYTLSSSLELKFPTDLRIKTDLDKEFHYVEPKYFFRKNGVYNSTERMFTIVYEGGTRILKINYDTDDDLELEYVSNYMVSDSDGSNRAENFTDNTTSRLLLIPDRHWQVIPYLAAAQLERQRRADNTGLFIDLRNEGINRLKRLIKSHGIIHHFPLKRPRIRSEWFSPIRSINNN